MKRDLTTAADRFEISEAMLAAAMRAGALPREDARRILSAGLSKMCGVERNAPFPLWVSTAIEVKRARFIGPTERRGYFRIQTEDLKDLIVHANDIQGTKGPQ